MDDEEMVLIHPEGLIRLVRKLRGRLVDAAKKGKISFETKSRLEEVLVELKVAIDGVFPEAW